MRMTGSIRWSHGGRIGYTAQGTSPCTYCGTDICAGDRVLLCAGELYCTRECFDDSGRLFGDLPEDLQILLQDLKPNFDFQSDTWIAVRLGVVADYMDVGDDLCACEPDCGGWTLEDYAKAEHYADLLEAGVAMPPLLVDQPDGLLRDGYHRLYALWKIGRATYPVIYLEQFDAVDQ